LGNKLQSIANYSGVSTKIHDIPIAIISYAS
jgi:hypothetical protein